MTVEMHEIEKYDLAGQHVKAVEMLTKAAKNGDIFAATLLGKRLLAGDRAPTSLKEGADLLVEAANQGGDEAVTMLSVLFATGLQLEQSWGNAFDCLLIGAERGSTAAQGQLKVLSADKKLAGLAESEIKKSPDYWKNLCGSIDFSVWNTPPKEVVVNADPFVCSFPGFIDKEICHWMIEKAKGHLTRAKVYDAAAKKETIHKTRTNSAAMFDLLQTDLISVLIQSHMSASCGLSLRHFERATVLHYDVGEEITDHFDFIDPQLPSYEEEVAEKGQRVITFLVYLNEDYIGGETAFPKLDICHKGSAGEGMFFVNAFPDGKPDVRTVHAGKPTSQGEKWIISQFIRSRPA